MPSLLQNIARCNVFQNFTFVVFMASSIQPLVEACRETEHTMVVIVLQGMLRIQIRGRKEVQLAAGCMAAGDIFVRTECSVLLGVSGTAALCIYIHKGVAKAQKLPVGRKQPALHPLGSTARSNLRKKRRQLANSPSKHS